MIVLGTRAGAAPTASARSACSGERGFTLVEMLIGLTLVLLLMSSVSLLVIEGSRLNRSTQMAIAAQATARNCSSVIVQTLRTAGWDPLGVGIPSVLPDPDPTDDVEQIEVYADLDEDGSTVSEGERVTIRHSGDRLEWRRSADPDAPFETLGVNITNDSDGDGTSEPMFVLNPPSNPETITVTITARSPSPDPRTGRYERYTVSTEVVLRNSL